MKQIKAQCWSLFKDLLNKINVFYHVQMNFLNIFLKIINHWQIETLLNNLPISQFSNGKHAKIVFSWVHTFCSWISCSLKHVWCVYKLDEIFSCIRKWKDFIPIIHASYAWHLCVKYMNPWKNNFHNTSITKILDGKFVMKITLTYDSSNSNSLSFNKFIHWVIEQNKVGKYVIGG